MKKLIILALAFALAYGCASKASNQPVQSAQPAPRQSGSSAYDRANSAADSAFDELDCEISGSCPVEPQPAPKPQPAPQPTIPQPVIPEKPKPNLPAPVIIGDKANPNAVADKARPTISTKYPIVNGYPAWFSQPNYDGYLGGVGVAKAQTQGYGQQRRIATALAQADLSRSVSVNVYNEATSERYLVDTRTAQIYQEKFSTLSKQAANEYLQNPTVMDEWLDEKTGELYVWVVLPK